MTEAVQEQELEFWDMWKKSHRSSMDTDGSTAANTEVPAKDDESQQHPDAPPTKYPSPRPRAVDRLEEEVRASGNGRRMEARANPGMTSPSGSGKALQGRLEGVSRH